MALDLPRFSGETLASSLETLTLEWTATTNGVALTFDAPAAAVVPIGGIVTRAWAVISTAISGGGVTTCAFGDAVDPNRWGDAGALIANTTIIGQTAVPVATASGTYTSRVTLDAAATAGAVRCFVQYEIPVFSHTY